MQKSRLNKFISHNTSYSRREADELIKQGKVSVNGRVVSELATSVSDEDKVKINGRIVRLKKISDLFFDKIWNRKEKEKEKEEEEKLYYLEYYIYGCIDLQKQCQIFYNNVMVYYQQMATQGNGVTDKNMQAWAEEQLKLKASLPELSPKERDSLRNLLVIADTRVTSVFIDTGQKPYMLVTQSNIDDRPQ